MAIREGYRTHTSAASVSRRDEIRTLLMPAVGWPGFRLRSVRGDLEAAFTGALIAIPQAIALAALAGLAPQYGIYASIVPVIIAILWGSSWHLVSGPNTAVSLMLAAAVAPLAAAGKDYLQMILLLTFLVGSLQLLAGMLRLGSVLDFVSNTVIIAVTHAVALILLVSALLSLLGLNAGSGSAFFGKLWVILTQALEGNPTTFILGTLTIVTGLLSRLLIKRYALVIALIAGSGAAYLWMRYGGATETGIPLLGAIPLSFSPWSIPPFDREALGTAVDLIGSAVAIAFVGLMQSVVISRSLALKSGQAINPNRECVGQGMANLSASFVSAFAGSGSFNRSASHLQLGARTPLALIYSVLLLLLMVVFARPLLEKIPQTVIAALLFLVGLGLFDIQAIKRILLSAHESAIFISVLAVSLVFGLSEGVLVGVLLSLLVYLAKTSQPRLYFSAFDARDGRRVSVVGIDGNLFFGSVPRVEQALPSAPDSAAGQQLLLIQTAHLTYLDIPGAELLLRAVKHWRDKGSDAYIKVADPAFIQAFEDTGLVPEVGMDCLIRKDRPHLMKDQLTTTSARAANVIDCMHQKPQESTVKELAQRIHATPLLGPIPLHRLTALLESQPILNAEAGDIIVNTEQTLNDHIILLEGELEVQRTWPVPGGYEKSHTWVLRSADESDEAGPMILGAASKQLRARALTAIRYLRLDADAIDQMLGWYSQQAITEGVSEAIRERMALVRQVGIFHHIPLERITDIFKHMNPVYFKAGDDVVREGDKGDSYYVIEEGEAEVIRTDPFTDETATVAHLVAGDGFGEESLLQDGFRNATVRMVTPGKLLELTREDFERLIRPSMVEEISAEEAYPLLQDDAISLLDCRYDLEYEESRIPNAILIPLHELRERAHQLDPDVRYIVYCRSGRRSKAAAFLLKERNLSVASLTGGIRDWPYEIDSDAVA